MDTQQHTPFYAAAEELINNLGSLFADRAFDFDSKSQFVQKNYNELPGTCTPSIFIHCQNTNRQNSEAAWRWDWPPVCELTH